MPVEILEPQVYGKLGLELDELSRRAVQANVKDIKAALELSRGFEDWSSKAGKICGPWSGVLHRQALEMSDDLKSGYPVSAVMGQLLRILLEARRLLAKDQSGRTEGDFPSVSTPDPVSSERKDLNGHLYVRPEDRGLFQLFLQEAPTFLSGIQSNLLLFISKRKADLQQVHQLFHVLQGRWGFLGFLQMRRLCEKAEALAEPFLADPEALASADLELLLKILGSCRSQVDRIAGSLPREGIEIWDAAEVLKDAENRVALLNRASPPPAPNEPPTLLMSEVKMFRVQETQMENLLELFADLVFAQSSFLEGCPETNLKGKNAADAARMTKVTHQIRDLLLVFRMVPLKPLFDHLDRVLNHLSRQSGKMVCLAVESPDIEVDQQLLAPLADLITQLFQNAIDHGIEPADERKKAGKSQGGTLKLKAVQQAGSVIFEVEDDGRGLDLEKLRRKGQALGLLSDEKTTSARVMEMIFKPGVTTLEASEESRGAGLDQVEDQVESLHGSIRVQSRTGQGCKFIIKVPRTRALIEGWVVEAARKRYLLPLSQVRKITHPAPAGKERGTSPEEAAAAVVNLGQWLEGSRDEDGPKFSVHVESGSRQFRVLVDEVHGKQQVLVRKKTADGFEQPGVRSEGILPDGKVVWVLDTRQFVASNEKD
jgi:chemotaxis protein histidine kinase CheA